MASHFSFLHLLPPSPFSVLSRFLYGCSLSFSDVLRVIFSVYGERYLILFISPCLSTRWQIEMDCGTCRDQLMSRVTSTILWHAAMRRERGFTAGGSTYTSCTPIPCHIAAKQSHIWREWKSLYSYTNYVSRLRGSWHAHEFTFKCKKKILPDGIKKTKAFWC